MEISKLNEKQLNRLSEFLANFSLLVIATMILPNLLGFERLNLVELLSGVFATVVLLLESMLLLRIKDE